MARTVNHVFIFLSFIYIFNLGFTLAKGAGFKLVLASGETLNDASERNSSSKVACAHSCTLALNNDNCTAFHYDPDTSACTCGIKMSFGVGATDTDPYIPIYVNNNCDRADPKGTVKQEQLLPKQEQICSESVA